MTETLSESAGRRSRSVFSPSKAAVLLTLAAAALCCGTSYSDGHSGGIGQAETKAASIIWQRFDVDILKLAKSKGQPAIVYFHADWCVPCIELDRYTFGDSKVIDSVNPFLKLKVDWTEYASVNDDLSPEAATLKDNFTVYGIPTIIFIDRNGDEIKTSRITGFADSEEFLQKVASIKP
jgi:thiol:disulfide interchange protein